MTDPLQSSRRRTIAVLSFGLQVLLWLGSSSALAASSWIEIESDSFVLVTDLPQHRARALLLDFEKFQFAAARLIAGAEVRPKIPTYVLALSAGDFSAIARDRNTEGQFFGGAFANYIVYDHAKHRKHGREVVFHEYIHYLLNNNPGVIYPAWYNEGLAELFSTLTERDGRFELGHVPIGRAYTIAYSGLIPTEQLMEIDYRSPEFDSHRLLPQFYAQAWLTAHYLMIGNEEHAKNVKFFLQEINKGSSAAQATQAAFGIDPAQLHHEIERYWKSKNLRAWRMSFVDPLPTVENAPLRTLSSSQAMATLGQAALVMYKDPQRAAHFLDDALKEDPTNPVAAAGMAFVKEAQGQTAAASALLERALARPGAVRARLLSADLLLARARSARDGHANNERVSDSEYREPALRARDLYRSLLGEADAYNAAAYGYARAAMLLGEPQAGEVLPVVRRATANLPTSTRLAEVEAALSMAAGDLEMASAAASRAARYATSFEQRKAMLSMVEEIQERSAGAAAKNPGK